LGLKSGNPAFCFSDDETRSEGKLSGIEETKKIFRQEKNFSVICDFHICEDGSRKTKEKENENFQT
jgi:hypothetical protein